MSVRRVPPLSVMPPLLRQTKIGVPVRTVRVFGVAAAMIVAAIAANYITGNQLSDVQRDLANEQATTVQIANEKKALQDSSTGGDAGAQKIELVKSLIKSRQDWADVVKEFNTTTPADILLGPVSLALGGGSSDGTTGTPGAPAGDPAAAAAGAPPTGAPQKLQMLVGAPNLNRVRSYIAGLERRNKYVESAVFKSAREGGPGLIATVEITVKSPPARPAPVAGTATSEPAENTPETP